MACLSVMDVAALLFFYRSPPGVGISTPDLTKDASGLGPSPVILLGLATDLKSQNWVLEAKLWGAPAVPKPALLE